MKLYLVQCDKCRTRQSMKWNGEHWLAPEGWAQLYDDFLSQDLNRHLCPTCSPVVKVKEKPTKRSKGYD
jgi:hypothetical protein